MKKKLKKENKQENIIEINIKTGKIKQTPLNLSEETIEKSADILANILLDFARKHPGEKVTPYNVFERRYNSDNTLNKEKEVL